MACQRAAAGAAPEDDNVIVGRLGCLPSETAFDVFAVKARLTSPCGSKARGPTSWNVARR